MYDIMVFENLCFRPSGIYKREARIFQNLHSLKRCVFGDGFHRIRVKVIPEKTCG